MKDNYDVIKSWLHDITSSTSSITVGKDVRLPRDVLPELYEIEIKPNMYGDNPTAFNFVGHVTIHVHCKASTSNITLHSNKLSIDHNKVKVAESSSGHRQSVGQITVTRVDRDTARQFVIVHLDQNLKQGHDYTLYMEFSGPLKDDLAGLYLSSYKRDGHNMLVKL